MWPCPKNDPNEKIETQPLTNQESEQPKSFFSSPAFIKAKGVAKIAFGALVLIAFYGG
jgi:hypothetical protein